MRVWTAVVMVTSSLLCVLPAGSQPTMTGGPWKWEERPSGLYVELGGEPFIVRELVQLIDRSTGWKEVPLGGAEGAAREVAQLDDGRTGTRGALGGRLKFGRETWVEDDTLHVSVECEIGDPGEATDFYYSLELPAPQLADGAWRAVANDLLTGAALGEQGGGTRFRVEAFDRLELLGAPGLIAIEASAEGATWSFQDWRREPHDAYRLRVELPPKGGLRWSGKLTFARAEGTASDAPEFLAEVQRAAMERLSLAHEEKLAIRGIECLTREPTVGRTCELRLDIGCTYDDPFDPQDVDVTASIKTPSRAYSLPAFYHVPFERERTEESDEVRGGGPEWRVRFLPTEAGRHEVQIKVTDRTGALDSEPITVEVSAADWPGLVRVSKANPLALEWEAGQPFYPIGINVFDTTRLGSPLPANRTDRCIGQIERLAKAKGDFIRLRMDSWWFAIDNPPDVPSGYLGPGRFNQRACWDVDRLLQACEKTGVQVMLCIENANANVNSPREGWRQRFNAYARENGGPCATMADFWMDETARELMKRKIRYCVARWGASPALAAWEFFNEVVIGGRVEPDPVIAWHDEMAREFKRLDPHQRLVTTSPMGERDPEANRRLWEVEALDIAQVHDYAHINTAGVYDTAQHGALTFGKPFLVGEFGMHGGEVRSGRFKHGDDPEGLVAHLGRWSTAMSLSAGTALDWYISNYVDALDLWGDFARVREFTADLARTDAKLKPVQVAEVTRGPGRPLAQPEDVIIAPREKWEKSPRARYVVADDGALEPAEGLNGFLWGTENHADLREPPMFEVDYPAAGRFVLRVGEVVGRGSNLVQIILDGKVALEEDLVCEQGQGEKSEVRQAGPEGNVAVWYNRDLAIDVPPGKHEIRVENLGRDRLSASYRLEGYATREKAPAIMAVGLQHASGAHVWIHNQSWSAEAILGRVKTVTARDVKVSLQGLRDGPAKVEWWEPVTGRMLRVEDAEAQGGRLELAMAELPRDLACKVRYTR